MCKQNMILTPWMVPLSFSPKPLVCGWYGAQRLLAMPSLAHVQVDLAVDVKINMRLFPPSDVMYKNTVYQMSLNLTYFVNKLFSLVRKNPFGCTIFIQEVHYAPWNFFRLFIFKWIYLHPFGKIVNHYTHVHVSFVGAFTFSNHVHSNQFKWLRNLKCKPKSNMNKNFMFNKMLSVMRSDFISIGLYCIFSFIDALFSWHSSHCDLTK